MADRELDFDGEKPAGDNGAADLELLRRESRGKDKKISELQKELEALRARDTERAAEVEGHAERLAALAEKAGELRAIEESLKQREEALNYALENKLSIPLVMANAGRLEAFRAEVEQLHEEILAGVKKVTADPRAAGKRYSGIELAHLGRMSQAELARIPEAVLSQLLAGGKR